MFLLRLLLLLLLLLLQRAADADGVDPSAFSANERQALASLAARMAPLRAAVGSAGLTMFRQIDADGSGCVSRAELLAALARIPPLPAAVVTSEEAVSVPVEAAAVEAAAATAAPAAAKGGKKPPVALLKQPSAAEAAMAVNGATEETVDALLRELDVDGDGTVDEDEWVAVLTKLPYLKVREDWGLFGRCPKRKAHPHT
jgi:hypothetical protein